MSNMTVLDVPWPKEPVTVTTELNDSKRTRIKREGVLREAERLINGDRADQYGDAYDTHERIGQMWSAILGLGYGSIRAVDVALMMDAVKTIRAVKNPQYPDSWIDKAGYSALGGEFGTRESS